MVRPSWREPGPLPAWRRCQVKGCCGRAYGSRYCSECIEQINALYASHALHDGRESRARVALSRFCMAVRRRMCIPLTVFVIAALLAFGASYGPAVCEWIADGGWLQ